MSGSAKRDEEKDYYQRQELITWWDQSRISKKRVLILGVGGIGTHVALGCCRLGVGKLHLVDNDLIEGSNLNRQVLYSIDTIGESKSPAARNALGEQHSLSTELHEYDFDIFKSWPKFIEILGKVDLVLNGLDCPETKRLSVASACLAKGIPMIYAGTDVISGNSGMVLYQDSSQEPCYNCLQDAFSLVKEEFYPILSPSRILEQESIPIEELTKPHETRPAATTYYTASIVAGLALSHIVKWIHEISIPHRVIIDILNLQIEAWRLERTRDCQLCKTR